MTDPIVVTVIGGYLGAGKTTLVNHILRSADDRIAVLVNDFGSVNIDASLIESADGDTISLANGCICCSLVDGFGAALDTVRARSPRPERLVIEASGVANPAQVAAYAHAPGLALDAVITVVDAERVRRQIRDELIADVIDQQIEAADLLVLNKCDRADDAPALVTWLSERSSAKLIPATDAKVDLTAILGIETRPAPRRQPVTSVEGSQTRFETRTETFEVPLDRLGLETRLRDLPDDVARVKGLVRFAETPDIRSIVQVVGSRVVITEAGDWTGGPSILTFISVTT